MQLERAGVPTLVFVTDAFVPLAESVADSLSLAPEHLRMHVLPHPVATAETEEAAAAVRAGAQALEEEIFAQPSVAPRSPSPRRRTRVEHNGGEEEIVDDLRRRGWIDGLPIVLPTGERVERMLGAHAASPQEVVGPVPPSGGLLTLEALAANAVMAGCDPSYFPFVVAAARAIVDPRFNLLGVNTTTNAATPLLIACGPFAREVGIEGGNDVLSSYHRANVTIGRAIRLTMINVGDCRPGGGDMATQGQAAKVGTCITENVDASPWEPLHVELGCAPEESALAAVAITGQLNVLDFGSRSAAGLLHVLANTIATPGLQNAQIGGGPVLLLGIEHARMLASAGMSKANVKQWLFEHARVPLSEFGSDTVDDVLRIRRPAAWASTTTNPSELIPVADAWTDFTILVAGGAGSHSVLMPTFLAPRPVLVPIEGGKGAALRELRDALAAIRQGLQADGADLELEDVAAGTLRVRLLLGDETCADCIVDKPLLEAVIQRAVAARDPSIVAVELDDPRPPRVR